MKSLALKKLIESEVKSVLAEDYARGIPDFALTQVAAEASNSLKRHLQRHIQQVAQDPMKQRQMLGAANVTLEELEAELKELLEDKLAKFIRLV